ncbi:maleylpyruvate isomerase N-terminal domain-containing protein [Actinomadura macra]|uniref:maleylpyruvate isomerase N-terminal domain-containing protein n=1 Tax=Actinomadura macra TaxID=46164 RepID=UPI000833ECA4|nr:maleylpyruvate isomerase N-terminal domain-containing protein [Actinomadura macra]
MLPAVTAAKWSAVRRCVEATGDRFAELLPSAPSEAMATADWSVADTAAHLVMVSGSYASMLKGPSGPTGLAGSARPGGLTGVPALDEIIPGTTVDTLAHFNDVAMAHVTERSTRILAARLRDDVATVLRACDGLGPDDPIDWLGGSRVPVAGLLAHLANEMQIHGRDIARTTGARWEIAPADAALFFELFLLGVTRHGHGRLLDRVGPERPGRIAVEFRSHHTTPAVMVLTNGQVTIGEPRRDIDLTVFFEPVTLNLMLFGRVSVMRAALTGKVVVWGRRPWLLPPFMRKMRLP